ncbi:MAG: hypothetical protein LBR65_07925 [Culturomica sp.]|jgi:hypothetical protein|nr:hypothetical protein [Culturomica sp.]
MNPSGDERIKSRWDFLDDAIPPDGHIQRFEQRLDKRAGRKRTWFRGTLWATAAASVILLLGIQLLQELKTADKMPEAVSEVAGFYNRQLEDEIEKLLPLLLRIDREEQQTVLEDIRTMTEETEVWEKNVPKMTEEELIARVIDRYHMQIGSIRHIRGILEQQTGEAARITF